MHCLMKQPLYRDEATHQEHKGTPVELSHRATAPEPWKRHFGIALKWRRHFRDEVPPRECVSPLLNSQASCLGVSTNARVL